MVSNKNRTVIYTGYTNNLERRMKEHANGSGAIFTKKYNAIELIYYEVFDEMKIAKKREKQLKNWHKEWKWNLIKTSNPELKIIELTNKGPETSSGHN